jgi:hypothetical protein
MKRLVDIPETFASAGYTDTSIRRRLIVEKQDNDEWVNVCIVDGDGKAMIEFRPQSIELWRHAFDPERNPLDGVAPHAEPPRDDAAQIAIFDPVREALAIVRERGGSLSITVGYGEAQHTINLMNIPRQG